ncbi:MAG: ThiF family adenylyltransferase [Chloroflexota bacterium]
MEALNIEPTYRVVLGDVNRFRIMLVGCGGTGSALAANLASLAYHAGQKGVQVELTLVDHDVVELKNCGRQNLALQTALAGGVPKAADLALRLNAAYGLNIAAWPQPYEAAMAEQWLEANTRRGGCVHLIIGCVDNHLARRELAQTVARYSGSVWAIDSGNDRYSGQALIGNLTECAGIKLDPLGLCSGLPSPYVQEPDLLAPDPSEQTLSCAERTLAEEQSLMVNRMAATIVAQYVTDMALHREVRQLSTAFNLAPPTMSSRLITASALRQMEERLVKSSVTIEKHKNPA